MVEHFLTADQNETQFFFISEVSKLYEKGFNSKTECFLDSQKLCQKPKLYKIFYGSFFVNYQGVSAIPSSRLRTDDFTFKAQNYSVDKTSRVSYISLNFGKGNGK